VADFRDAARVKSPHPNSPHCGSTLVDQGQKPGATCPPD
jgi:hypothetical protein